MAGLKRLGAIYLILVASAVAVFFIVNPFFVDSLDVDGVWLVLDALMAAALAIALAAAYTRKRGAGGGSEVTRGYLEANVTFYLTAAVTILFLHGWFTLLALGQDSQSDNSRAVWTIWAAVDTLLPIVLGVTGCRLWREASTGS